MELKDFLQEISERDGVSGFEKELAGYLAEAFAPYVDETRTDHLGNLVFLKKGLNAGAPRLLMCAHMDEIGFMVTKIEENGFLRFTSLGGFDHRTLPGQEVTVYGGPHILRGVIGFQPSHLLTEAERKKSVKMEDLFIDTGLPPEKVGEVLRPGSIAAVKRDFNHLLHNFVAGKALDDRAGVALLWQCAREMKRMEHEANLYFVATVQEEVGLRGAVVTAYGLTPDLAVAVDVCHGDFPGSLEHEVSSLGKGPVITRGPNIHPGIEEKLLKTAKEYHLPFQQDVSPGPTGTDARAIQISGEGIPTGLLSIPLRYMHTSVELANLDDIKIGGRLLAYFAAGIDGPFVEGLTC